MAEAGPHGPAEVAEGDGGGVGDEDGQAGHRRPCLRAEQVERGQDVGVGGVGDVREVVEVEAVAQDDAGGAGRAGDEGVDGREEVGVAWAEEDGGPERGGEEGGGRVVGREDEGFGVGLLGESGWFGSEKGRRSVGFPLREVQG